ncbi:MAG: hypothetical protein WC365_00165 [Candidatus Babeliales bacterium]|jgi:hypothetical protein
MKTYISKFLAKLGLSIFLLTNIINNTSVCAQQIVPADEQSALLHKLPPELFEHIMKDQFTSSQLAKFIRSLGLSALRNAESREIRAKIKHILGQRECELCHTSLSTKPHEWWEVCKNCSAAFHRNCLNNEHQHNRVGRLFFGHKCPDCKKYSIMGATANALVIALVLTTIFLYDKIDTTTTKNPHIPMILIITGFSLFVLEENLEKSSGDLANLFLEWVNNTFNIDFNVFFSV